MGFLLRQRNFCRDRVSLALCRDRVFRVPTGFLGQAHDPTWACVTGMPVSLGCARDRAFWLCVATRRSLSRHCSQACWVVWVAIEVFRPGIATGIQCRDRVWLGQVWVTTRVSLCCDKVFLGVGHSCRDKNSKDGVATGCFSVATHRSGLRMRQGVGRARQAWAARVTDLSRLSVVIENPGIWDFPCRDMGLMSRHCMVEARGDRARDRARMTCVPCGRQEA